MIKILDKYLIKSYLKYYLMSLMLLVFLFLLIDVVTMISKFDAPGSIFTSYYLNYSPWVIYQMMPIAGVLATVFLFINLQRASELVIFYSLGISLLRVLFPIVFILGALSVFGWVLSDKVIPKTMDKRNYYYYVELKKKPGRYNKGKNKNIWFRTPEAIVNFGKILSKDNLEDVKVSFYSRESWQLTRKIEAKEAIVHDTEWEYKDGVQTTYGLNGEMKTEKFKVIKTRPLEDLTDFKKRQSNLNAMSLSQLSHSIKKGRESSMATVNLETEFHGKLSFLFSAIFLSLLALPFCLGNVRSANMFIGVAFSVFIVLVYWVVYSAFLNMGREGVVPPIVAGWFPGVMSVAFSAFQLKKGFK